MKATKEEMEARRNHLETMMRIKKTQMEQTQGDSCLKNRWHFERKEAETEDKIASAKVSQEWRTSELEQEDKLASEMEKMKREEFKNMKLRQQLRESEELKELESQLRTAYTLKELAHQIEHKRLKKLEHNLKEKEYAADREAEVSSQAYEQQRAQEQARKTREYREFLQDQMLNKYKAKQEEYKMFLHEKAMIDDAVKTIIEEDRKEEEARMLRRKKNKEDIQQMIEARKLWMIKEKEQQDAEDRRVRDYLEQKMSEEMAMKDKHRIKQEKLTKNQEQVATLMSQAKSDQQDRDDLILFLAQHEMEEKAKNEDRKKIEDDIRRKVEMNTIFSKQVEDRMARLNEERKKDEEFSKKLFEEFAQQSKMEQMSAEKQKREKMLYLRHLKEDIEERHKKRLIEAQSELSQHKLEEKAREERRRMIEEERIRLLQEHAGKLVGFLPRGVLRETDLPLLGSEVQEYYKESTKSSN